MSSTTSPTPPADLRKATQADTPGLTALREDAAAWLASRGIEQWTADWDDLAAAKLAAAIDEERTWVVDDSGQILATVTIGGPDSDFWTSADQPDSAFYVYRLTAARSAAGRRYGELLLDWVGECAEHAGRQWVRLDCWRTNTELHTYYERCRFQHVRTVEVPGRKSGALFERSAAIRTYTAEAE
jgi:GNAT superfamily N-acetyltransferase